MGLHGGSRSSGRKSRVFSALVGQPQRLGEMLPSMFMSTDELKGRGFTHIPPVPYLCLTVLHGSVGFCDNVA